MSLCYVTRAVQRSLHEAWRAQSVEATEGDAIASVAHVLDAVETENVARKGSQASEDARIAANTTGVLAEAAIADVVGAVFDTPYTVPLV